MKEAGLPICSLKSVLALLPLPPNCPLSGVSSKWRCVVVPRVAEDDEESTALKYFCHGVPCKLATSRSQPVHNACGADGLDFVTDRRWNNFPKPKIAFKAGWAGPGTEMEDNQYHALVSKFSQIVRPDERGVDIPIEGTDMTSRTEADEVLNLQMFHRPDTNSHPDIPVLSRELVWPPMLLDGAECDNATRVSQRGAVTWWHLDDSGEFVMQTALPVKATDWLPVDGGCDAFPGLIDRTRSPVKLFLYGPPDSYDWFIHDDEADVSGKLTALNIFETPDELLPDAEDLPILRLAVLEAGGAPLISPPNIPHVVVTLNDCVMVEQRRVSNIFLDEVSYLLQKLRFWRNNPIIYTYVSDTLQDENVICGELVPSMVQQVRAIDLSDVHGRRLAERMAASLLAIATFPKHYNMPDSSRSALEATLAERPFSDVLTSNFRAALERHWDVRRFWSKSGCVLNVRGSAQEPKRLVAVVYRGFKPVFGPTRGSMDQCAADYKKMEAAKADEDLVKYLASVKNKDDELLDDLF